MKAAREWMQEVYYVDCPYCGHTHDGETSWAGIEVVCEGCEEHFKVDA